MAGVVATVAVAGSIVGSDAAAGGVAAGGVAAGWAGAGAVAAGGCAAAGCAPVNKKDTSSVFIGRDVATSARESTRPARSNAVARVGADARWPESGDRARRERVGCARITPPTQSVARRPASIGGGRPERAGQAAQDNQAATVDVDRDGAAGTQAQLGRPQRFGFA